MRSIPPARLIALLCLVSFVAYPLRTDITIAQEVMAPALGLTMVQMGIVTAWGFQLPYALAQIPAGVFADRLGARTMVIIAISGWMLASIASGSVGGGAGTAFFALIAARALLGAAQAITYPTLAMVTAQEIPADRRVGASAFYFAAATLGSALAPVILAPVLVRYGWRAVFVCSASFGLIALILWLLFAPRTAPRLASTSRASTGAQFRAVASLLRLPAMRWLSLSYALHSAVFFVFVFWFVRYLTEARGFGMLATGLWASVPHLMATVIAPLVGRFVDSLGRRLTPSVARRRVAITCLLTSAILTLIGTRLSTPALAVFALGLAESCLLSLEAPFWTTATELVPSATGAAGGLLNLMGNLGGVVSIWLVPVMTLHWGWTPTLTVWAGVAAIAGLMWQRVRVADPA